MRWIRQLWRTISGQSFRNNLLFRCMHFAHSTPHRQLIGPSMMIFGGLWASSTQADGGKSSRAEMIKAIQIVTPSAVAIQVQLSFKRVAENDSILFTNGSGFIIDEEGTILTNAHVVGDMLEGGHLRITFYDGVTTWGSVTAVDFQSDLAIIRPRESVDSEHLDFAKYPPVKMSESIPEVGEMVGTIGNPVGLRHSFAAGFISSQMRNSDEVSESDPRISYYQTDFLSCPGNSGGPVFNSNGEVVGIILKRLAKSEGITFCIQIQSVSEMIDELKENGTIMRPWLGFKGISLNSELILQVTDKDRRAALRSLPNGGVLITKVHPSSPASAIGLKAGDVITQVNDKTVTYLGDILRMTKPSTTGRNLILDIQRINPHNTISKHTLKLHVEEFDILPSSE